MSDSLQVRRMALDNAEEAAAWDRYAEVGDSFCGYWRSRWLDVFREAFGHVSYPLAAFRNGDLVGILPLTLVSGKLFGRFLVSGPFVNYGGILADDNEAAAALAQEADELRRELGVPNVELRHIEPSVLHLPRRQDQKVSMVLDLNEDPEVLWKGFKDKVRNQVRKSRKCGLEADWGGIELLDDFYSVFCVNMRDLGTPVYAKHFFAVVLRHFAESTRIIRVRSSGRCVAAGITHSYGNTLQMPWASSLLEFRASCPNHMMYWEALSLGCSEGFALFDFGRSTPKSGPWQFKKQWGARELPLHWEYILEKGASLPGLSVNNPKFRLAIEAWKRLPLPVANFLGPKIVRGIP